MNDHRFKVPTVTTKIVELLRDRDDFMTRVAIQAALGETVRRTTAALHALRKAKVVDCVLEPDGVAWWYALPPEEDTRKWVIDEIKPEILRLRPSRRKKPQEAISKVYGATRHEAQRVCDNAPAVDGAVRRRGRGD